MPDPKYSLLQAKDATRRTTQKQIESQFPGLKYSSGTWGKGPVSYTFKDEAGKEFGYNYVVNPDGTSELISTGPIMKAPVTTAPKINTPAPAVEKKPVTVNPIVNEQPRKPIVFGTSGYTDPNTGQTFSYDAAYKQKEVVPNVQNFKSGGLVSKVKKYAEGGSTGDSDMSQAEGAALAGQGLGMATDLANKWAMSQEADAMSKDGTVNTSTYRNTGMVRGAAQGAEYGAIGLNPALMAATGGLSALAVPAGALIGGTIGGATGKKKGEKLNQAVEDAKKEEEAIKQQALFEQNMNRATAASRQGLKDGGVVKGAGTAKSDSISAKVKPGSFVVPAENADKAEEVRKKVLKAPSVKKKANLDQEDGEEVKLSNGEHLFTPEERKEIIAELGEEFLEMLAPNAEDKDEMAEGGLTAAKARKILHDGSVRGHKLTDKQRKYFGAISSGYKCGGAVKGYAVGGEVEETITEKLLNKNAPSKKKTPSKAPKGAKAKKTTEESNNLTVEQMRELGPNIGKALAKKEPLDLKKEQITGKGEVAIETTPAQSQASTSKEKSGRKPLTSEQKQNLLKEGMGIAGKASNFILPYAQTKMGMEFLKKAGKRPTDKLDADFIASMNRAQEQAQFGYTPEEKALIDQKNLAALRTGEAAAKLYSGGSGANAYGMQRQAANEYFGRGLEAAVKGKQLQLSKQQYADQLVGQKAEMSRRLFQDTMNAWQQNQQAGGDLVGAGLQNAIQAKRYNDELSFLNELKAGQNNWMQNI